MQLVVVCKVDQAEPAFTQQFISSIPALLLFKDGKIAGQHAGVTPEATLRADMERLAA